MTRDKHGAQVMKIRDERVDHTVRQGKRGGGRSEEHTSELQSHGDLVCRLLLEKKNRNKLVLAASAPYDPGPADYVMLPSPRPPLALPKRLLLLLIDDRLLRPRTLYASRSALRASPASSALYRTCPSVCGCGAMAT